MSLADRDEFEGLLNLIKDIQEYIEKKLKRADSAVEASNVSQEEKFKRAQHLQPDEQAASEPSVSEPSSALKAPSPACR